MDRIRGRSHDRGTVGRALFGVSVVSPTAGAEGLFNGTAKMQKTPVNF